jgi:hypothetical protein
VQKRKKENNIENVVFHAVADFKWGLFMFKISHSFMLHKQTQFHLCPYEKYDHRCAGLHETIMIKDLHTDFSPSFTQNQTLNVESINRN